MGNKTKDIDVLLNCDNEKCLYTPTDWNKECETIRDRLAQLLEARIHLMLNYDEIQIGGITFYCRKYQYT